MTDLNGEERPADSGSIITRLAVVAPPLTIAVVAAVQAFALGIGGLDKPQPGFYPLLMSILLALALIPVIIWDYACDAEPFVKGSVRVVAGAATVALFIVLWPILGLAVASSIALFLWMWRLGGESILSSAITAVVTSAACVYVFGILLEVPLPTGLIGLP